jgi:hypothetical protein
MGVLYGMLAVGQVTTNLSSVIEGKICGHLAFSIIDRKSAII